MAKKENHLEEVLKRLDVVHQGAIIQKAQESRNSDIATRAHSVREAYGIVGVLEDKLSPQGQPVINTQEEFDALSDDRKRLYADAAAQLRQGNNLTRAGSLFAKEGDKILRTENDGYIPSLASIALEEAVVKNTDEKYTELIQKYSAFQQSKRLAEDLKANKQVPPEVKKGLTEFVVQGEQQRAYHDYINKYGNANDAKLWANLHGMAVEDKPENLQRGAEEMSKKAEKELRNYVGEKNDPQQAVAKYASEALVKMARSGDPELEQTALTLLYKANKGYGIGGQSFDDVFKKKK